jgi:outer membrane protein assembly factor BamD (BamD/ComL family)
MKRTTLPALLSLALVLAGAGCASIPTAAQIPEGMSVIELSQKGQECIDDSNYKAAEVYYQVIIDRFGTDSASLTAAEFEIAHIRIKQKKWADATARLTDIITRYESAGGAGLPPEYLVLAKNDLARVQAATAVKAKQSKDKNQPPAK